MANAHKHTLFDEAVHSTTSITTAKRVNLSQWPRGLPLCFGKLRGGGCNPRNPPTGSASVVHTNVLTSRIASATGMDPAFHRVVNSHILRFAIAMRVYVRIFGAVTVW